MTLVDGNQVESIEMIWQIATGSKDELVVSKALGVLVNCFFSLDPRVDARKSHESLVNAVFERLQSVDMDDS